MRWDLEKVDAFTKTWSFFSSHLIRMIAALCNSSPKKLLHECYFLFFCFNRLKEGLQGERSSAGKHLRGLFAAGFDHLKAEINGKCFSAPFWKTTSVRFLFRSAANLVIEWFLASGSNLIRPSKVNDRPFLERLNVWHQYVVVKNNYYLHERRWGQTPLTSHCLLLSVISSSVLKRFSLRIWCCHWTLDGEACLSDRRIDPCATVASSQEHLRHKYQWFNIFPMPAAGVSTNVICHCQSAVMQAFAKQFIAYPHALLAIDYRWLWTARNFCCRGRQDEIYFRTEIHLHFCESLNFLCCIFKVGLRTHILISGMKY